MLVEDVNRAITEAMKAKAQQRLVALRMLKTALMNREIERGRALDENESRQVVSSLVKQRRDSIEQFIKGGRQDLADKETAEIVVLESYLPPPSIRPISRRPSTTPSPRREHRRRRTWAES